MADRPGTASRPLTNAVAGRMQELDSSGGCRANFAKRRREIRCGPYSRKQCGMIVFTSLLECSPEDWDEILGGDLTGAFHCTRIVGRQMVRPG